MALGAKRMLGIAVDDGCLLVAELAVSGRRRTLRQAAEFVFPEGLSLGEPAELGKALGAFLRQHRFGARQAIIGMPARWLVVKEKALPPSDAAAFAKMVRLAAEQAFSGRADELTVDYAADAREGQGRAVVMVAAPAGRVRQVAELARAAGLTARAAMPTAMALGIAARSDADAEVTLYLRPRHAEIALRVGGRFPVIHHVAAVAPTGQAVDPQALDRWADGIANRVHQVVSLLPSDGASASPDRACVWDGAPPQPGELVGLCDRLSLASTIQTDLSALGVEAGRDVEADTAARFAAPAALALAGLRGERLAIDLLHSRLAPPRTSAVARRVAWAVVVTLVLAVCGGLFVDQWRKDQSEVAMLRQQADDLKPDLEAAQSIVEKVAFSRGWYDQRPHFLDCLRELTLALPEQGTIWATSIAVREDMRAVVSGKSRDEQAVLEVLDRLKQSAALADVKLLHLREAGGRAREVSFAIRFTFSGGA